MVVCEFVFVKLYREGLKNSENCAKNAKNYVVGLGGARPVNYPGQDY